MGSKKKRANFSRKKRLMATARREWKTGKGTDGYAVYIDP